MQEVDALVQEKIDAEASQPVLIVGLVLNVGTLRYAASKSNLVFPTGGDNYTAKAMLLGNIKTGAGKQIIECEITLDNVTGDMHGYNAAERFDGRRIYIWKIYRDLLGSAIYYRELFDGFMSEPEFTKLWCRIPCTMGKGLQRRVLQKYFTDLCQNQFGDDACNYSGYSNLSSLTASGIADSGTASTLVDSALTQANDYWNFGRIELTHEGIVYLRKIQDFNATTDTLTFDVEFPFAVTAGDTYVIYKGCPKTLDACKATWAYGPSSNNEANFMGFIHIGKTSKINPTIVGTWQSSYSYGWGNNWSY